MGWWTHGLPPQSVDRDRRQCGSAIAAAAAAWRDFRAVAARTQRAGPSQSPRPAAPRCRRFPADPAANIERRRRPLAGRGEAAASVALADCQGCPLVGTVVSHRPAPRRA